MVFSEKTSEKTRKQKPKKQKRKPKTRRYWLRKRERIGEKKIGGDLFTDIPQPPLYLKGGVNDDKLKINTYAKGLEHEIDSKPFYDKTIEKQGAEDTSNNKTEKETEKEFKPYGFGTEVTVPHDNIGSVNDFFRHMLDSEKWKRKHFVKKGYRLPHTNENEGTELDVSALENSEGERTAPVMEIKQKTKVANKDVIPAVTGDETRKDLDEEVLDSSNKNKEASLTTQDDETELSENEWGDSDGELDKEGDTDSLHEIAVAIAVAMMRNKNIMELVSRPVVEVNNEKELSEEDLFAKIVVAVAASMEQIPSKEDLLAKGAISTSMEQGEQENNTIEQIIRQIPPEEDLLAKVAVAASMEQGDQEKKTMEPIVEQTPEEDLLAKVAVASSMEKGEQGKQGEQGNKTMEPIVEQTPEEYLLAKVAVATSMEQGKQGEQGNKTMEPIVEQTPLEEDLLAKVVVAIAASVEQKQIEILKKTLIEKQPEQPQIISQPEQPTISQPEQPTISQPEQPTISQPEQPTISQPESNIEKKWKQIQKGSNICQWIKDITDMYPIVPTISLEKDCKKYTDSLIQSYIQSLDNFIGKIKTF